MDKFLNRGPLPSTTHHESRQWVARVADENIDLLHQLRDASAKNENHDQNQPNKQVKSSSEQLWDPYFSRNSTYSISDISMSNRIANSGKTLQGWKIIDKKRVYTTFRNGKMVQGDGAEGYKLSVGDAPKSKGKKRGPNEISKQIRPSDGNKCNNNNDTSRISNSRINSCLVVESSKKVRDCDENKLLQKLQDAVSQNGVFEFSFG